MAKQYQFSIPQPCHENWEQMTEVEKGRFCNSCQKVVTDFTQMNDEQVLAFFRKKAGKQEVCGRLHADQLNRSMQAPRKRMPWLKYFFRIAIPAFLMGKDAVAQGEVKFKPVMEELQPKDSLPSFELKAAESVFSVSGKVVDEKGAPIAGATVVVKGKSIGTVSNPAGEFTLHSKEQLAGTELLQISSVGFQSQSVAISTFFNYTDRSKVVALIEMPSILTGEVVIITGYTISKKVKQTEIIGSAEPDNLQNSTSASLQVFPNPATAGSQITIDTRLVMPGNYRLQLVAITGQVKTQTQLRISEKQNSHAYQIPQLPAGDYVLNLISDQNKSVRTTAVIIR